MIKQFIQCCVSVSLLGLTACPGPMIAMVSPTKTYSVNDSLQCRGPVAGFSQKAMEAVQPLGLPLSSRGPTQLQFIQMVDRMILTGEVSNTYVVMDWRTYPKVDLVVSASGNMGSASQETIEKMAADIKGRLASC